MGVKLYKKQQYIYSSKYWVSPCDLWLPIKPSLTVTWVFSSCHLNPKSMCPARVQLFQLVKELCYWRVQINACFCTHPFRFIFLICLWRVYSSTALFFSDHRIIVLSFNEAYAALFLCNSTIFMCILSKWSISLVSGRAVRLAKHFSAVNQQYPSKALVA